MDDWVSAAFVFILLALIECIICNVCHVVSRRRATAVLPGDRDPARSANGSAGGGVPGGKVLEEPKTTLPRLLTQVLSVAVCVACDGRTLLPAELLQYVRRLDVFCRWFYPLAFAVFSVYMTVRLHVTEAVVEDMWANSAI